MFGIGSIVSLQKEIGFGGGGGVVVLIRLIC
jgi:hypothetical protein